MRHEVNERRQAFERLHASFDFDGGYGFSLRKNRNRPRRAFPPPPMNLEVLLLTVPEETPPTALSTRCPFAPRSVEKEIAIASIRCRHEGGVVHLKGGASSRLLLMSLEVSFCNAAKQSGLPSRRSR